MDRIKEVVRHVPEGISISFEFFPPKEVEKENSLWDALHRLLPLQPKFVSVTYGAGYSDRARTRNLVERIQKTTDIPVSPHLTCVGHTRDQLKDILDSYWQAGVRNLVAVRGDRAPGDTSPLPVPYALDLIELIRSQYAFEIYVAAYPDVHPAAPTARFDLDNLKRKIDAGATAAITQFFFDNNDFLRFRDRCRKAGIQAEIIPGILPVTNFERTKTFADRCGARVPEWFHQYFEGLDEEPETRNFIAAGLAIDQVQELHLEGVNHFHFYTLNRCELTYAICRSLGLRSQRVVAC
ncbi:MAG: methylenetetrahydrofolate reductase [NAD(P)H] [Acidobacteria bacterium]|nr:methylenetetrahydrofolate reductase [NAD(P)H] [Acidobacteriota bacterium]MCB9396661.1 methylenetetrahydrofolate reductase [NAD(P)H] [Acidobacteriota bacterium]